MATLKDLRKRIKSVKKTRKLTRAMKSVAAAKLKKAQTQVNKIKPYSEKIASIISNIRENSPDISHPFFEERKEKKIDFLIITADKGLCGAYNSNTVKYATEKIKEFRDKEININVITIGKKGEDALICVGEEVKMCYKDLLMKFDYERGLEISESLINNFIEKKTDAIYIVYNSFFSIAKSELTMIKYLPITKAVEQKDEVKEKAIKYEYEFEPSAEKIFKELLPKFIKNYFYEIMLESIASGQAARMKAMEMATRNADDMIVNLTHDMNKMRQNEITSEILDITTATEAMSK